MTITQKARLVTLRSLKADKKITRDETKELAELHKLEKQEEIQSLGLENYNWLTSILYQNDPIHLALHECPFDEYGYEARLILSDIRELEIAPDFKKTLEIVHESFVFAFGQETAGNIERHQYLAIAQEVYNNMEKLRC